MALVVGALVVGAGANPAAAATYPIESAYAQQGSWAVSTGTVTDAAGRTFALYYPTNLGAGGVRHPVVSWGNGTNAVPSQYADLLDHLASWGIIVVASTSTATGSGTEIAAGASWAVSANANASSAFYQKVDTAEIAAVGHSQGAGGSTRAVIANPGLFSALVTVALPAAIWVSSGQEYNTAQVTRPAFFLGGANDWLIASPSTTTGYYNAVPGAAAVGVLRGAGHNTIQDAGNGFIGYITAWLTYQLRGDTTARSVFVGPGELVSNTNWRNQATKNLS